MSEHLSDQVFHSFLSLRHDVRRHARQMIDERGLTPRDFSVLRFLLEVDSAAIGQVQAFVHKSPSTTSALIDQLESKGYLTRTRSQEDNRVVIVKLTPSGREIAENTPLRGLPLLRRCLHTLPEARLREMLSVLEEIKTMMALEECI
jgi:DNA-binding MarR family transcriptional regulator